MEQGGSFNFNSFWSLPEMQSGAPPPLPTSFAFTFPAPQQRQPAEMKPPVHRKTTKALLNRLFREDVELLDRLLSYLEPHDLASLARLNRLINGELRAYSRRMFSVNRVLSPFFKDSDSFREMQARTGTIISGSAALQLFERTTYTDADLDVYVEYHFALDVAKYLGDREGYTFVPRGPQKPTPEETLEGIAELSHAGHYLGQGIANVLDFSRESKKIQVIVSKRSPIDIILHFHSTCVMNIVTHSTAYSLFPRLTFGDRFSRTFTSEASAPREGPKWTAAHRKYTERGFTFVDAVVGDPIHGRVKRWIGDSSTWTIPLSPELPTVEEDTLSICSFEEVFHQWEGSSIEYDLCESSRLRFVYTSAKYERDTLRAAWKHQLVKPRRYLAKLDRPLCDAMYIYRAAEASAEGNEAQGRPYGLLTFITARRDRFVGDLSDSE
ncbi:hypothetical protein PENSPDRAFT_752268 [Peniophora sp. CONT]|nr:hypothetical protein PENSPDRAFT_752268 [Peniophora sp. CONT]